MNSGFSAYKNGARVNHREENDRAFCSFRSIHRWRTNEGLVEIRQDEAQGGAVVSPLVPWRPGSSPSIARAHVPVQLITTSSLTPRHHH